MVFDEKGEILHEDEKMKILILTHHGTYSNLDDLLEVK